jgi:hypothetical protein
VPDGHVMHDVLRPVEYLPLSQTVQVCVADKMKPLLHEQLHMLWLPFGECEFEGQDTHDANEVAGCEAAYFPPGQSVQDERSEPDTVPYFPKGHAPHCPSQIVTDTMPDDSL